MKETWDPRDCINRAKAPDTEPTELARLSRSNHIFVREAVAQHPATPEGVLALLVPEALVNEDDFRMAGALFANAKLPIMVLKRLAALAPAALPAILPRAFYQRQFLVALAANPQTSPEILGILLDPRIAPRHVREWIERNCQRRDVLEALSHDPSETISKRAVRRLREAP